MELTQYVVDAFTDKVFAGNPAAVCLLDDWLTDKQLASIAQENNLSETAFLVGENGKYQIRWFTPSVEVDLCGHATLASAYVVFRFLEPDLNEVSFSSPSGTLVVERQEDLLILDFPSRPGEPVECPKELIEGLGVLPLEAFLSRDYLLVLESSEQVINCEPKWELLQDLPSFGIIVTAPGDDCDFVSRVFFPTDSILEDPVTGSAHCTLIPYWSRRLGKNNLFARQLSSRRGELLCEDLNSRVRIGGNAVLYSKSSIYI